MCGVGEHVVLLAHEQMSRAGDDAVGYRRLRGRSDDEERRQ
ncbi:hypothetical protein [Mycobacterium tuberculosis]|nr:hypothetical protein [Mycobacterium tuberculosis]